MANVESRIRDWFRARLESFASGHVAEVVELDMQLQDGKIQAYRAKVKVSFKYQRSD